MKKMLFLLVTSITLISCAHQSQWELAWVENFNEEELDTTVWSTIPRGKSDWQNTMSSDERCYELRDGKLCGHSEQPDPYMILHDDEFFPVATDKNSSS